MTRPPLDPAQGAEAARRLKSLGAKRILIKAAELGYITEVKCGMPECFCPEEIGGAWYFEPVTAKRSDWKPTLEHYPIPKREGGRESVTTVGYGDIVPTSTAGQVVGGVVMVTGVSFIAFLTATVTSTVIQRGQAQADEDARVAQERNTQAIIDEVTQTRQAITTLGSRLEQIESKLTR